MGVVNNRDDGFAHNDPKRWHEHCAAPEHANLPEGECTFYVCHVHGHNVRLSFGYLGVHDPLCKCEVCSAPEWKPKRTRSPVATLEDLDRRGLLLSDTKPCLGCGKLLAEHVRGRCPPPAPEFVASLRERVAMASYAVERAQLDVLNATTLLLGDGVPGDSVARGAAYLVDRPIFEALRKAHEVQVRASDEYLEACTALMRATRGQR
jgi:hypothetical protein